MKEIAKTKDQIISKESKLLKQIGDYLQEKPICEILEAHKSLAIQIENMSMYYGIKKPEIEITKMMALDILENYPRLRLNDLTKAFKLAAQGKIEVSLELYGKPMNGWLINQILKGYKRYMQRKKKEAQRIMSKQKLLSSDRSVAQCPEEISKKFDELIEKYKTNK